ncbi:hypothetical protein PIB30_042487 [Stylosanthes scabra]|uniref:Uncharacterized protein n=1 Tax=Stylosanthes scabra TaxID=79078 RepID=A0ABU6YHL3_9FABA|nr:hypothetical protein [Stylosanthes scabra]
MRQKETERTFVESEWVRTPKSEIKPQREQRLVGRKGRLRASRFLNYQCERLMATDAGTAMRWLLASRRGRRLRRDDGHVDSAVGLERRSLGVWWWLVWESQSETLQEDDRAFG